MEKSDLAAMTPSADAVLDVAMRMAQAVVSLEIAKGNQIEDSQDFVAGVFQNCLRELTDHAGYPATLRYILKS